MERLKALRDLVRARYTGQVLGIVSILSIKSNGFSVQSLLAILSSLFLSIALFSYDDAQDHKSDSIVHPGRPIPRGILTPNQVYFIGTISFILGILLALRLHLFQFLAFLFAAFLGLAVIFLKLNSVIRACLIGSILFALFPFGLSLTLKSILFGLIVALPHIGGSIAKDYLHARGDETIGLHPPPTWTTYMASLIFFLSGGITLLPLVLNLVTWIYFPLILPTLVSCLILGYKVLRKQYQKVYIYGAVAMLSTLVALAVNI